MKTFLYLLLMALTFSLNAEMKVLKSASNSWPPFIDKQNPKGGLSLEIARASFATQGYKIEQQYIPWARAMKYLKEGKIDIIVNTWMTDERKGYLMFSEPYLSNQVKFIKLKNDKFEYTGLKSLAGKTVGTVRGYGYGDKFNNAKNFKREDVNDFFTNIKKLVAGRIDLAVEDEIVAKVAITQKDAELLPKITFTKNFLSKNDLHVTSGLSNPNHKKYIAAFNKGLKIIKANGTYKNILNKYGIK